jgi:hypothetical protein
MRSKLNRPASSRKPIIGITIIVTTIIAATIIAVIMAAIITVVITATAIIAVAGGTMAIATAVGGTKTSTIDQNPEASGLQSRRFFLISSPEPLWVLHEVDNPSLSLNIRFYVALGGGERSMSSEHLNVPQ